jgi:AraC-like DNA-binding protein
MTYQASLQDSAVSEVDPSSLCSFDYEAIEKPTHALMHQAARFLYFKNGIGTMVIDGTDFKIRPRTLVAITPWRVTDVTEVKSPLQFIKIIYDYQYLKSIITELSGFEDDGADLLSSMGMQPVLQLDSMQAQEVENILDALKEELGVSSTLENVPEKPLHSMYTCNKLIELMIDYDRYVKAASGTARRRDAVLPGKESVLTYIYAHSSEKLTLSKVAKVFYVSESTLSKHLNQLTGSSFSRLLTSIRIEKASDYLIYTNLNLEEIAGLLGFVDASHLSKKFVAKVGITPIRYRRIYSKVKTSYTHNMKEMAYAITDYLYKNYDTENLTASETASHFGISVPDMNRALLYYSEKNFDTLLNFIRINRASELLLSTERPILDVAVEVGYSNVKTFNLNFYKIKGMNPSEFRAQVTLQKTDGTETRSRRGTGGRKKSAVEE